MPAHFLAETKAQAVTLKEMSAQAYDSVEVARSTAVWAYERAAASAVLDSIHHTFRSSVLPDNMLVLVEG